MAVTVRIPAPLRNLTSGQGEIAVESDSLAGAIDQLEATYPGIRDRLCDEDGEIRRFVNIYVNGEDVRFLDGITTRLGQNDEVSIVPAVAGG